MTSAPVRPAFATFPRFEVPFAFPFAAALSSWASVAAKNVVCGTHAHESFERGRDIGMRGGRKGKNARLSL